MRELAAEYKRSIDLLNKRIKYLIRQRDFLTARTRDPEKDPDIIDLNHRLKPLREMHRDLQEICREVRHYYDRSWWRSEVYTCNKYKSGQHLYARSAR